ncbi:hypothetical protein FJU08_01860 [Martelella alba]|uniref:Uncharacterized protein n=1 Tax=Martelella alba TaxID=2590451 RepID=A0A506UJ32_9HYPH|nr:hypothetical protein [Martelella alba]TPW33329.1 hypothetical protein FJU08_01860 [Martelella alba]
MQAMLIMMTIFGCDDSLTQCEYVDTAATRYETVAQCDAALETSLARYDKADYPTVIAVCQDPDKPPQMLAGAMPDQSPVATSPSTDSTDEPPLGSIAMLRNFAEGLLTSIRATLPSNETISAALAKPVHVVTNSYSWVIRKTTSFH